jgi:hypothetical protein
MLLASSLDSWTPLSRHFAKSSERPWKHPQQSVKWIASENERGRPSPPSFSGSVSLIFPR